MIRPRRSPALNTFGAHCRRGQQASRRGGRARQQQRRSTPSSEVGGQRWCRRRQHRLQRPLKLRELSAAHRRERQLQEHRGLRRILCAIAVRQCKASQSTARSPDFRIASKVLLGLGFSFFLALLSADGVLPTVPFCKHRNATK